MAEPTTFPPFHLQSLLTEIYRSRDLLDLSEPGPSSPPRYSAPSQAAPSIFSSATSIAAAAGRRAAAVASAAASPSSQQGPGLRRSFSPDRAGSREGVGTSSEQKTEIRCVEGYGSNLYIGGSDGVVEWWVCDGSQPQAKNGWILRHKFQTFPKRPISKITLLPKLFKALVLSEGRLHPLTLPHLEPIPSNVIAPLQGVVSVVLDDDELDWGGPGSEDRSDEMTVVVVRRRGLGIYRLGNRMTPIKEIPLPSPPFHLALSTTYLCAAIPSSNTYSIIDLSDASLTEVLPVSQIEALDFDVNPNVVVVPGEDEFLVTSYTGASTMGVFLNGQGDPVRGTMEWPEHPLSIAIEAGFVLALLRNHTICIHSLADLEKPVQIIPLATTFEAITLSYSPYGLSVRDAVRDERMITTRIRLLNDRLIPREAAAGPPQSDEHQSSSENEALLPPDDPVASPCGLSPTIEEPPSGSGLTPPSSPPRFERQPITPPRNSSLLQVTAPVGKGPFSRVIAETLMIGLNGIDYLAPTPIILKVDALCQERKLDEATALVDAERRKGRRGEIEVDKIAHQGTVRLLHLHLACHLFLEAMFEKAGEYFHRGKIDPRLLVRLFPEFRGKTIGSAEEIEVFAGLQNILNDMPTVNEIISTSIHRNYSPHLSPDTETAPESTELRAAMTHQAQEMLIDFLRKTRGSRRKGGGARGVDSRKIDIVIDTTLSKLLAESGTTNELLALLAAPNDVITPELEPFLSQRPYVLATVMRQQGRVDRVLALLREIAESTDPDPLCEDPVDEIAQQLDGVKNPELFLTYILWLAGRDVDKAMTILLAQNPKTGVKLDDTALINDLRKVSDEAANRYLEHVVVIKRSPSKMLHEQLLANLFDAATEAVQDDGIKYHLEELDAEYRLLETPQPYCVFIADFAPDTPIKHLRLKLMLFLQGSPFVNLNDAAARLEQLTGLKTELAVVYGRLGRTRPALQLLARDIGDGVSAQAYCTQGGEIIPPRVAHLVAGHVPELVGWATLGDVGRKRRGTVDAKTQEKLVMELLGVYMRDGASTAKQTAALLNAQSLHLDMLEVLALVPPEWPVDVVSSFFQRSLRRQMHDRASWQILKAVSAGQNLQTSEQYLDRIKHIPPTTVHGPSRSPSGMSQPDEGSIPEKEYEVIDEKKEEERMDEKDDRGREGFFSPEEVDKELRDLGVDREVRGETRA